MSPFPTAGLVMSVMDVGKGKVLFFGSELSLLPVPQPLCDRMFAFLGADGRK